jgi:hypothetical protein
VRADVGEAQRAWLLDEQAEQAAPLGPVMNLADLLGVKPDGNELDEALVLADDAERAVPGVDEVHGRLNNAAEHRLKLKARPDRDDRLKQAVHPVPGAEHGLKPRLELREQVVQPKLWQQAAASRVLHASYINGVVTAAKSPGQTGHLGPTLTTEWDRIVAVSK